jgi:hypothetical protein
MSVCQIIFAVEMGPHHCSLTGTPRMIAHRLRFPIDLLSVLAHGISPRVSLSKDPCDEPLPLN